MDTRARTDFPEKTGHTACAKIKGYWGWNRINTMNTKRVRIAVIQKIMGIT